jgi:hypothetical protein
MKALLGRKRYFIVLKNENIGLLEVKTDAQFIQYASYW